MTRPAVVLSPPIGRRCDHFDAVLAEPDPPTAVVAERAWPRQQRRRLSADVADLGDVVAGLRGPVVLVGASYGGLVVRCYAALVPGRVAGVVLLDAVHEDLHAAVSRWVGPDADVLLDDPEGLDLPTSFDWARHRCPPGSLGDIPLVVLSRDGLRPDELAVDPRVPAMDRLWDVHQRMLATSSTRSRWERVPGAGHLIAEDRPDVVAAAIREVSGG